VDRILLDTLGRDAFIDALDNPALEFKIREKEPGSLNAALTLSMKLEVLHKAREMQKESAKLKYVRAESNQTNRNNPRTSQYPKLLTATVVEVISKEGREKSVSQCRTIRPQLGPNCGKYKTSRVKSSVSRKN